MSRNLHLQNWEKKEHCRILQIISWNQVHLAFIQHFNVTEVRMISAAADRCNALTGGFTRANSKELSGWPCSNMSMDPPLNSSGLDTFTAWWQCLCFFLSEFDQPYYEEYHNLSCNAAHCNVERWGLFWSFGFVVEATWFKSNAGAKEVNASALHRLVCCQCWTIFIEHLELLMLLLQLLLLLLLSSLFRFLPYSTMDIS